jgi:hypothetical protein
MPCISHPPWLDHSNYIFQVRGFLNILVTSLFLRSGVVSPTPNPQAGGPPLVGCPRLLIQYIRSYSAYLEGQLRYRM